MLEALRTWLNGNKEYWKGVILYEKLGDNADLLELFKKGPTSFTTKRLGEILLEICNELKSKHHDVEGNQAGTEISKETLGRVKKTKQDATLHEGSIRNEPGKFANSDLHTAAHLEATKCYKQTMNDRAVLFSMLNNDLVDLNTPDRILSRAKLSVNVVTGFIKASALFDKAAFVAEFGHLPDGEPSEENEYDHLPDNLVKSTLDNLRKNYNKMKKREQTPERVALMQKHEANIQKLALRWDSLKLVVT